MNYDFKKEWPGLIILALAWSAGWYFYQHFPAQVVTHWNFYGQPDAWGGKTANAWMFPGILTAMYILFSVLPAFDPRKDRYPEFAKVYRLFKNIFLLVMFIVMLATGLFNLGYNVQIQYVVPTVIGLLMIVIGNYMGKIKPNWFMGIRTPWTLSSENVWNKTHRVGGYAFIVFGLILIVVPFLPAALGLTAFVAGILIVTFGTFVYSYLVYRQERTAIR